MRIQGIVQCIWYLNTLAEGEKEESGERKYNNYILTD